MWLHISKKVSYITHNGGEKEIKKKKKSVGRGMKVLFADLVRGE